MEIFTRTLKVALIGTFLCSAQIVNAQQSLKSLLINHGAPACGSASPEQQFFIGTTSGAPSLLQSCNNALPFYSVFTAYNPKDRQIYFADISTANTTKLYALDYNLTGQFTCASTPTPTYTYNYRIDQLCFDANGDNLAIFNFDPGSETAMLKRIEVSTGLDIAGTEKKIYFPAGNAPNSLAWGDMVFMPNGRVFMTFGNSPSKLYELENFDGVGDATALFIANIPRPCYSIGYVDGNLIVAGSDGSGCYYYTYDINSNALSDASAFPLGKTTADMTHMNVGVGVAQELIGANIVSANTADLIYYVHLKNKGNIDLANVQLANKLTDAFGAGNISNVSINFVSNPSGLILNSNYDGVNDVNMLQAGQTLSNYPVAADSFIISIQFRATNIIPNQVYYSSAIGSGSIGAGTSYLPVIDSSNNGNAAVIDLDVNGVSDDAGEGIPTPFMFNLLLTEKHIQLTASLQQEWVALNWMNRNESNIVRYDIQKSIDGIHFTDIKSTLSGKGSSQWYGEKDVLKNESAALVYYRIKALQTNGKFLYSNTALVQNASKGFIHANTFPNPFVSSVNIQFQSVSKNIAHIKLFDAAGKLIIHRSFHVQPGVNTITLDQLDALGRGIYFATLLNEGEQYQFKILK